MMFPIIMNTAFERLAAVDDYSSFIWTSRYYTSGDFEICVPVNSKTISLMKPHYYVVRDDDDNVGIIENIKIQRAENGLSTMIVSGRFLDALLGRRIIGKQTTLNGKISTCINRLINENVISPQDPVRQIEGFTLGSYNISQTIKAQYTGKNLLVAISDLCKTYGIGYKVTLDAQHHFVFQLYQGTDRTYDQTVNPWVIFSDKYDNLLLSEYQEDYSKIITAVLVAGEGEGQSRTGAWVVAVTGFSGMNRYEAYKDQRNISSDGGEISEDEYTELLTEAGKELITQYTRAFTGTVYFDNIKYKQDVELGDLCVIENTQWGLHINSRLIEVIESVNEAGEYQIVPTFGI